MESIFEILKNIVIDIITPPPTGTGKYEHQNTSLTVPLLDNDKTKLFINK